MSAEENQSQTQSIQENEDTSYDDLDTYTNDEFEVENQYKKSEAISGMVVNEEIIEEKDDFVQETLHQVTPYGPVTPKKSKKTRVNAKNGEGKVGIKHLSTNEEVFAEQAKKKIETYFKHDYQDNKAISANTEELDTHYKRTTVPTTHTLAMFGATWGKSIDGKTNAITIKEDFEKESNFVINSTLLVNAAICQWTKYGCFQQTIRPTKRSQCKQTIFNYPINPKNKTANASIIGRQLVQLQHNILNAQTVITKLFENNEITDLKQGSEASLKAAVIHAERYLHDIILKAREMLKSHMSVSCYSYPSVTHSFYIGDYTDIFAFLLLSYLYKTNRKEIKIGGDKDFTKGSTGKTLKDVLEYERGRKGGNFEINREETFTGWTVKGLEGLEKYDSKEKPSDVKKFEYNEKAAQAIKVENGNKEEKEEPSMEEEKDKKWWYEEPEIEVLLRPTRSQKIILVTDPWYFVWKIPQGLAKGIGVFCSLGLFPKQPFDSLRIASSISGAMYKLSITKAGIKVKVDTKLGSFASLPDSYFTQHAVFMDAGMIKRLDDKSGEFIDKLIKDVNNKKFFFTSKRFPRQNMNELYQITKIGELGFNIDNAYKEYLENLSQLTNHTWRHIFNCITDSALLTYAERLNNVVYYATTGTKNLISLYELKRQLAPMPKRGAFKPPSSRICIPQSYYLKFLEYNRETVPSVNYCADMYVKQCNMKQNLMNYVNDDPRLSEYNDVYQSNISHNNTMDDREAYGLWGGSETLNHYAQRMQKLDSDNYSALGRIAWGWHSNYLNLPYIFQNVVASASPIVLANSRKLSEFIRNGFKQNTGEGGYYSKEKTVHNSLANWLLYHLNGESTTDEGDVGATNVLKGGKNIYVCMKHISDRTNDFNVEGSDHIALGFLVALGYINNAYKSSEDGQSIDCTPKDVIKVQPISYNPTVNLPTNNNNFNNNNPTVNLPTNNNNFNNNNLISSPSTSSISINRRLEEQGRQFIETKTNQGTEGNKGNETNSEKGGKEISEIQMLRKKEIEADRIKRVNEIHRKKNEEEQKQKEEKLKKARKEFANVTVPSTMRVGEAFVNIMTNYKRYQDVADITFTTKKHYDPDLEFNVTDWRQWLRVNYLGEDHFNNALKLANMTAERFHQISKANLVAGRINVNWDLDGTNPYDRDGKLKQKFFTAMINCRDGLKKAMKTYYGETYTFKF